MTIEIDSGSGFCFGVTTAINKAEEELKAGKTLYCLGDIVHNGVEVERLAHKGLITINHEQFQQLHDATVLLRAHGEPPSTYETAQRNNITIIDATCPVVLALQRRVKRQWEKAQDGQVVIFGKKGHAEVLGLVGQTHGGAIVVENLDDVRHLDFSRSIFLSPRRRKASRPIGISSLTSRVISPTGVLLRVLIPSVDQWPTVCLISPILPLVMNLYSS